MANPQADAVAAIQKIARYSLLNKISFSTQDLELVNLSFSLSGEDMVLRKIFKTQLMSGTPGFYVDLGCSDPRLGSNTFLFYCYGWRGICIDANPRLAKFYKHLRPRDAFVNAAVGPTSGSIFHAMHKANNGMGNVRTAASDFGDEYESPTEVKVRRLSDILDEHVPAGTPIEIMSIDIEGSEFSALQSNDWTKHRPQVIILETQEMDPIRPLDYPTVAYLIERGYKLSMIICGSVVLKSEAAP